MVWLNVLAWAAIAVGVVGYLLGLRGSRYNDKLAPGLVVWIVLAWVGVAMLLVDGVA